MENIPFDILNRASWERWMASEQEDNCQRLERLRRNLPTAIDTLTPRQREMVELYFYRTLSVTAIAGCLGVNKSTVSRTLRRARGHLRELLRYSL